MSDTDPVDSQVIDDTDHGSQLTSEIANDEMDESFQTAVRDFSDLPFPTVDDANEKQTVVLVVANSRDDTVGLVESLKRSLKRDGDWGHHETAAGVRIHDCKSLLVVDTIPLHHRRGGNLNSTDIARRWISRNGLRRMIFGKDVFVVCVLLCRLINTRKSLFEAGPERWMEPFGLIFKPLRSAVLILAKMEGKTHRSGVEVFIKDHGLLQQNIIYLNGDAGDIEAGSSVEDSRSSSRTLVNATMVPFSIPEDQPGKLGLIWSAERVILFGRTGSGKSTLAQMLTQGDLDAGSTAFVTSSSIRGETTEIQSDIGRGWYVLDTPGFGESEDPSSSLSTLGKRITKNEGAFSHYLYVVKKGRLDRLDEKLWDFFSGLFGEETVKQQFSVVVSNAHDDWIEENISALKEFFTGCKNFFSAKFPATPRLSEKESIHINQEDFNRIYREKRKAALTVLEEELAKLGLVEVQSRFAITSKLIDLLKIGDYATLLPGL
ncbi:unnamed protein product [Calypogeia fissa]